MFVRTCEFRYSFKTSVAAIRSFVMDQSHHTSEVEDKDKPGPGAYDITEKRPLRWSVRPGGKPESECYSLCTNIDYISKLTSMLLPLLCVFVGVQHLTTAGFVTSG